ncbi:fumarate hydratase class II [Desulfosalsimonas propionicica]|uniref:Fumarate hydratase class II n=1 Tax=Desulfosalsimonas propionicica TaxID=332175 RepID=A0A7W0C8N5_9BACT|nr:class II fumarate hydratase [Desulfosalsimonas propionicica]MBA2881220.1 fumarate hydratase class II [Desulfosalsimonas propionicica]
MDRDLRKETDSLGTMSVPAEAYYGAQTRRAMDHFAISGRVLPMELIYAMARIKKAAARINGQLGEIPADYVAPVVRAADEIMAGRLDDQFLVDVFQTGSGTSANMNVNEVVATRANELLTGGKSTKMPVHPNDHVNRGQSTNDVMPSAIHISARLLIRDQLLPAMEKLEQTLWEKSREFAHIRKIGRTHLQDAVVMTMGQEFSGYAAQMRLGRQRLEGVGQRLCRLALGGTAVGTGLNAHPEMAKRVIAAISEETGIEFSETANHFEAQSACDTVVETSGVIKAVAAGIAKIANDIRWLASGPRCGLGEIRLPALLPGSSIMPGKINPVMCEAAVQASAQVIANDTALTLSGQGGYFQLNLMLPLTAFNIIDSIKILANAGRGLAEKCISGIVANEEKCEQNIRKSLAVVTGLVPYTGYDKAAQIAARAYETGKTIEEVAGEENILPAAQLQQALYGSIKP